MNQDHSPDKFILLTLLAAAAGALLFQPRYYVGFFNDDASFVLLARLIPHHLGTFSFSGLGARFSHFLPGYPVFLAPFVALVEPHWALLRLTTAAVSVLTVYGLWLLLGGWLPEKTRRWATALYAIHPLFLVSSGLVMADPFLTCLFVFGLLGLRWVLEGRNGAWAYALLLSMSAWAPAAKPIGILLPAALTAALIPARAWKALRLMAAIIWLPCLILLVYSLVKGGTPTDYTTQMLHGLASLSQQPVWARGYNLLHAFVLVYGLSLPWPRGPVADPLGAALIAALLFLCVRGVSALLSKPPPLRFVAMSAWLLLVGQLLVMAIWTVYSERYALPILPLGILFVTSGVYAAFGSRPSGAKWLLTFAAAGLLAHTVQLAFQTYSPARPSDTVLYTRTLEWFRGETSPESKPIGNAAVLCLYTGRCGNGLFAAANLDIFLSDLARDGITHALVTDQAVLSTKGNYGNDQARQQAMQSEWVRHRPRFFRELYANREEGTEVYGVEIPAGRRKAEGLYVRALLEIRDSGWTAAEKDLRGALAEAPDYTSAIMALASLKLLRGKDPAEAERLLRRALATEPNYPRATRMLAELLERQGRKSDADKVRAAGQAALSKVPFEAGS